ncbi:MAG: (Fe-S)-binding protein [Actinomycetota bacterium]
MGERTRYCPSAIYDPHDPAYLDEATCRRDLAATFGRCVGCAQCVDYCSVFPGLFALLDRLADRDPERMTPAQQDDLVDECHQCRRCVEACGGSTEGRSDDDVVPIDLPRMIARSMAMRVASGHVRTAHRRATRTLARNNVLDRLPAGAAGSRRRRWARAFTGISAARRLPGRSGAAAAGASAVRSCDSDEADVAVVRTCLQRQQPVAALVGLLDVVGVPCREAALSCCGAPALYGGDLDRFGEIASSAVAALSANARAGRDIVVTEPACAEVLREYLVHHVDPQQRIDAEVVAAAVCDAVDYLEPLPVTARVDATTPTHVVAQRSVPGGAPDATLRLLERAGAHVHPLDRPVGDAGGWRLRATNDDRVDQLDRVLIDDARAALTAHPDAALVAESSLAAVAIEERLGRPVEHVLEWLARGGSPKL